ncbi:MAG: DPP IV N-terminal domain-containing protein, partial [Gemmatimonadetes bacterium]|nr:DPP IV N-terminal domain-containing protein [Gemmatimonadota bacterium]
MTTRFLRRPLALAAALTAAAAPAAAQDRYLLPPDPIPAILDARPTPSVMVGRDRRTLALLSRAERPGIAEMAEPELQLAGYRISPRTNGVSGTRDSSFTGITFQDLATGRTRPVPLPAGARVSHAQWSPDGRRLAFVNAAAGGLELWVADVATGQARRLTGPELNGTMGSPFRWLPDNSGFIVARVVPTRGEPPRGSEVPTGPIVQENAGRTAAGRTYQDLLQSPADERLFDYYFTAQLSRVPVDGGAPADVGQPGIYPSFGPSPDGRFLLVRRVKRPYSYVVPASAFPRETAVWDMAGRVVKQVADIPLTDDLPAGFDAVARGPRAVQWRSDASATLVWVEAQDGGDPRREASVRDRVFVLDAPFTAAPTRLLDLEHRLQNVWWGRGDLAIVTSRWWNTRRERRYAIDPSAPGTAPRLLADRGYQDRYGDPGSPLFTATSTGHRVMEFTADGRGVFVTSQGASERGNYPFLDVMDVATGQSRRLWRAADPYFESVVAVLRPDASQVLTRRESPTEPANYFVRPLPRGRARAVTNFPDPAPQLAGIQRQLITYTRPDGVRLSGTLYLPPGYDARRDGRLPLLMWAYPAEFRDTAAAGQVRDSPNRFSRPSGTSHLFVLLAGYAVLDNP